MDPVVLELGLVEELDVLAEATGRLWLNGATPDWQSVQAEGARRISLPTYPFEPERHWIVCWPQCLQRATSARGS